MSDELPDINVTRGEKALAGVLVVFLLIGGLWVYFSALPREAPQSRAPVVTAEQRQSINLGNAAERRLERAEKAEADRERSYEEARENYRTELDADTPATKTRAAFVNARDRLASARRQLRAAT